MLWSKFAKNRDVQLRFREILWKSAKEYAAMINHREYPSSRFIDASLEVHIWKAQPDSIDVLVDDCGVPQDLAQVIINRLRTLYDEVKADADAQPEARAQAEAEVEADETNEMIQ